ncbi:hypothetical protein BGX28_004612 [Mortierella sp. GBA30]|nr:hypothetical protein BGX28_004612 [Mortierella sp. GBA30]
MSSAPPDPPITATKEPVTETHATTETTTKEPETTTTHDVITTTTTSDHVTTTTSTTSMTTTTTSDIIPTEPTTTTIRITHSRSDVVSNTRTIPVETTTTTTTAPYTTQYVTTMTVVTITMRVPRPTIISGSSTTIFIPVTTIQSVPTLIPDPDQPPPGLVFVDKKSMATWQIVLIVVACLVVAIAASAVILVAGIKKRRRKLDEQQHLKFQQQQKEIMFGGGGSSGDDSILDGSVTDATSGAMSSRTLITPTGGEGIFDTGGSGVGGMREWMSRFTSWRARSGGHGAYHGPVRPPAPGPAGGLWLMEDAAELGNNHEDAFIAGDMPPVSYMSHDSPDQHTVLQQLQQDWSHQSQQQEHHHNHRHSQVSFPLPPQSHAVPSQSSLSPTNSTRRQASSGSATTTNSSRHVNEGMSAGSSTDAPTSPSLLQPLIEERLSTSTDRADEWGLVSNRVSFEDGHLSRSRATMYVDPATLERNSMYEHVRKAPQALPQSDSQRNLALRADEAQADQERRVEEEHSNSRSVNISADQALQPIMEGDVEQQQTAQQHLVTEQSPVLETTEHSSCDEIPVSMTPPLLKDNVVIAKGLHGSTATLPSESEDVFYPCPEMLH